MINLEPYLHFDHITNCLPQAGSRENVTDSVVRCRPSVLATLDTLTYSTCHNLSFKLKI